MGRVHGEQSLDHRTLISMYSQTSLNSHGALDLSLVKCEVCGALARGKHYSVFSCDGCKGFFKRYYNKDTSFRCENGGSCDINKDNRASCRYCRLSKCMNVGMSLDPNNVQNKSTSSTSTDTRTYTYEFFQTNQF